MDTESLGLVGFVLLLLIAATVVVSVLRRRATDAGLDLALVETFRRRVRAWWMLFTSLAAAFLCDQYLTGQTVTVVLFGLISFWALREFITLTPTRPGDHRALFWVFFVCTPLQFVLVGMKRYDLYSTLIPVYAFLFILARVAMSGDAKRFLERTAKIQAGLLICVYCLSFAPALLTLEIPDGGSNGGNPAAAGPEKPDPAADQPPQSEASRLESDDEGPLQQDSQTVGKRAGGPVRLLFFFVLIVQLSDALQYIWARLPNQHVIAPTISSTRTWEGLLCGTASVTLLGTVLWWITEPFDQWWQAACASLVIALMGFAGGLTMSAIKRDRGVQDFGTLVEGHGGVLDRIDSLCFAAPVFFHLAHFLMTGRVAPPSG
ncbi:MAG: phosphatidate cytidylyltransferase [Planctomycetota bacterium]